MTAEPVIRVALVGAGAIGAAHAQAAAELPGVELVAVSDARPAAAAELAARHGGRALPVTELLAAGRAIADLVVVATPPATHVELSCALLEAGTAVLCEKPLTIDLEGARRLAATAERSGALLSMASKFRFVADVGRARELADSGALGKIVKTEVAFAGVVDMTSRWNADPAVSGGGVLVDNGTHGVDVVRYVRGAIAEVFVAEAPRGQRVGVDDSVTVLLRTVSGELAQVDVTWSYRRISAAFLTVLGTDGAVEVGWRGSRLLTAAGIEEFGTGYDKIGSLRANLADVAAAVRGTGAPRVGLEDALASVSVVDAAHRSLADGRWEKVEVTP
jgi:predicted dehydrogenase